MTSVKCAQRFSPANYRMLKTQLAHRYSRIRFASSSPSDSPHTSENSGSSGSQAMHLQLTDSDLRSRILEAALDYVHEYGWSRKAVEAACVAGGFPPGMHTMATPQGGVDLALYFYASRNQQLADTMVEWRTSDSSSSSATVDDGLPPRFSSPAEMDAFLYRALKYRLEKIIPVLPVWPQALGLLALPSNMPSSIGLLAQLVDEIWAQCGDRTTDMTWYAKRLGLAYVYNLTEVYMLQDRSPDLADSWVFLESRLADLRSMKQMDLQLKAVSNMLKSGILTFGNVTVQITLCFMHGSQVPQQCMGSCANR
ncbi:Ubiquinone biosynthesis protein coq9, mitochondrial [Clonorchis sinensis]|uniref:Ubiquinone biosynthesis protein n=1 Tax=Clonorchis sinensis TaxID=79923 RepID=A0A8T1M7S6_CLOSI|nr:Ubiquinone biosynthesis protein coq9, mitochondrial [Clonorchis sinensis]